MSNDVISLNKPLPCPFCRNDLLEIKREGDDTFTWHQVWCPACGCKGPGGLSEEN
ncbi:hypothetical protein SGGMMB4_04698 [Sodalis glossinidius str. 'morsitans']|uniref:Restriction alleviation protein, Lar family n=1 Tax=Sodalis glossinidius (strain morsitans) TaxID=343509 RepID=A0A193QMU9_SODGM|nr:hypothetical protein SGGMMB4_04698 [Sodalis glossinidius str. 'morsitans']